MVFGYSGDTDHPQFKKTLKTIGKYIARNKCRSRMWFNMDSPLGFAECSEFYLLALVFIQFLSLQLSVHLIQEFYF